jgi:glucan 1,3-beta-glucosidase
LVAEADAQNEKPLSYPGLPKNLQQMRDEMQPPAHDDNERLKKRAGSSWWMENISHPGKVPYGGDSDYVVFRNVKDYGAVGDGKTDDTASINKAMTDGNRCGSNCGASTVKPAIVYFPAGTYLVSSSIVALYNTQMIGNANDVPIIKAASSFVGLGVISSDVYTGGNGGEEEWYINQNNFLRQLRNFIIDVRGADMTDIAGVHWQVAQATSIQNVVFYQSDSSAKSHQGVFAENGSGGFMSGKSPPEMNVSRLRILILRLVELTFIGGAVGIRCGNQQFTVRNFAFVGCRTAIDLLWDWGWTWKSMLISLADVAFNMNGTFRGGSLLFLDSSISDTNTAIKITTPKGAGSSEQFTITIDNLELENVGTAVFHEGVGESLAGGSRTIDSWTLGKVYDQANPKGTYQASSLSSLHPKTESLMHAGGYYQRSKPQYEDYDANTFLNAQLVAKGDGTSDDSFALSLIIKLAAALSRPLFIPFGSYIVTQSINIPVGAIIVGECWSQIVAKGAFFSDVNYPQAMIIVGSMGDKGSVEIQDIMFTTEGPTAGVVLVEW